MSGKKPEFNYENGADVDISKLKFPGRVLEFSGMHLNRAPENALCS